MSDLFTFATTTLSLGYRNHDKWARNSKKRRIMSNFELVVQSVCKVSMALNLVDQAWAMR